MASSSLMVLAEVADNNDDGPVYEIKPTGADLHGLRGRKSTMLAATQPLSLIHI